MEPPIQVEKRRSCAKPAATGFNLYICSAHCSRSSVTVRSLKPGNRLVPPVIIMSIPHIAMSVSVWVCMCVLDERNTQWLNRLTGKHVAAHIHVHVVHRAPCHTLYGVVGITPRRHAIAAHKQCLGQCESLCVQFEFVAVWQLVRLCLNVLIITKYKNSSSSSSSINYNIKQLININERARSNTYMLLHGSSDTRHNACLISSANSRCMTLWYDDVACNSNCSTANSPGMKNNNKNTNKTKGKKLSSTTMPITWSCFCSFNHISWS